MCWISSFSDTICVCLVMSTAAGLQSVKSFLTFLASCSSFHGSAKLLLLCRIDREDALLE